VETRSHAKMYDELKKITHPLDLTKCDVFEETLLTLAGITEQPKICRFDGNGNISEFSLGISSEASKQFIAFYSQNEFTDLAVTDITEELKQNPVTNRRTAIETFPVVVVTMNAAALQKTVLPLIQTFLLENPKKFDDYARLSYTATSTMTMIRNLFAEKQMDIATSNCFAESIAGAVQRHLTLARVLIDITKEQGSPLQGIAPPLLDIICGYIHPGMSALQDYTQDDINSLTPSKNIFVPHPTDRHAFSLYLPLPEKSMGMLGNYFNHLIKKSASMSVLDAKEKQTLPQLDDSFQKITIQARTFNHADFIADLEDESSLAFYGRINCIATLKSIRGQLSTEEYKPFAEKTSPLIHALAMLINHIESHGYSEQEKITQFNTIIEQHQQQLQSQINHPFTRSRKRKRDVEDNLFKELSENITTTLTKLNTLVTTYNKAIFHNPSVSLALR
jgi:hypothetical protein